MTYDEIKKNKEVCECLKKGNENLGVLGFTDHSAAHCTMVAKRAAYILKKFGYSESDIEMVKIAGFMHDIGNVVNRSRHAEYGAILANEILKETDMSLKDRITVVSAIGHHDESTGGATDPISAALIIADKTDVRRNRVRNKAKEILKEITSFFGCRLATGVLDWACMLFFVDILKYNDVLIKILANVLVIVLNYVASKVVIFKKRGNSEEKQA